MQKVSREKRCALGARSSPVLAAAASTFWCVHTSHGYCECEHTRIPKQEAMKHLAHHDFIAARMPPSIAESTTSLAYVFVHHIGVSSAE